MARTRGRDLDVGGRVAFLGPAGTFSEHAARAMYGPEATYLERPTFEAVFEAVASGAAAIGVVPVENAIAGTVPASTDALLGSRLRIRREHVEPVRLALLGAAPRPSAVRRVLSHPHALAQCRRWLAAHAPRATLVATSSTAAAVLAVRGIATDAALADPEAGRLQGVPVIADDVADAQGNATRFVAVARRDAPPTGHDQTTIVFGLGDGPGALRRALEALERHGVNLTRLVSRPSGRRAWAYVFVADVEGHRLDADVRDAFARLRATTRGLRVLGSYPRVDAARARGRRSPP